MAVNMYKEFEDLRYEEYDDNREPPYYPDVSLSWDEPTVMPVRERVEEKEDTRKGKSSAEMGKDHNSPLIMKKVFVQSGQSFNDNLKRSVLREAQCLKLARHHHVVRFERAFFFDHTDKSKSYMAIVMDRADDNIVPYLQCKAKANEICSWFQCLANVVAYIHGLGITHRDIKPPNILVKNKKVLLADFGISKMGLVKTLSTTLPNSPRSRTIQYAAPEVENGSTRGRSADVFSLGAVFLEILVAHSYEAKRGSLEKAISSGDEPSFAKNLNQVHAWMKDLQKKDNQKNKWQEKIIRLCQDMMNPDRDERPNIDEVYQRIHSARLPTQSACCVDMIDGTNATDDQRLLEACKRGDEDKVRRLIEERKASPKTVGALHQASANNSGEIVQYLISQGADVNLLDYSNKTALHCAAGCGHKDVVDILLRKKANVDVQDGEGRTPLLYASGHGDLDIVSSLLKSDARISVQDNDGQTALHLAARGTHRKSSNHKEVIKLLLKKHTNAHTLDHQNRTPQDCAKLKNYQDRVKLLGNDAPGAFLAQDPVLTEPRKVTADTIARIIDPPRQYSDRDVEEIANNLREIKPGFDHYTKISIVLYNIMKSSDDVLQALDKFNQDKITDHRFPFKKEDLTGILEGPGAPARFLNAQHMVLDISPSYELGKHYNLPKDEWGEQLIQLAVLGSSESGAVYKVGLAGKDKVYALKTIRRSNRKAVDELATLKRTKHKNIVQLVGSFTSPQFIGLLMDPAADCNLAVYLNEDANDPHKQSLLLSFFGCLVDALSYLHNEVYVRHNDIKPQNILVHHEHVFLADFGISLDWSETLRTTTVAPAARTPQYCAPEVGREGQSRNSTADIWSLGCVFLEMMTVLKGRQVEEIPSFLRERGPQSTSYGERLADVLLWIKILEAENDNVTNEPFEWIRDMLHSDPRSRPEAGKLRQILEEKCDSNAGLTFFGSCCRESTLVVKGADSNRDLEKMLDDNPIDKHTSIAAVSWSNEMRLYVQGTDGGIRQATRKQYQPIWEGGRIEDTIAEGRLCTPIAATVWQQATGHRQPMIRVYYLNENSFLRERSWDPFLQWTDGDLNKCNIKAAESSKLAVTSWGDGNIILCYQSDDNDIHILNGWAPKSQWRRGSTLKNVVAGSPLAATNFEHLGKRALRIYCELVSSRLREFCWDKIEDEGRDDSDYYQGGYIKRASSNGFISAIASKGVNLEMFIYYSHMTQGILENQYSGVWLPSERRVGRGIPAGPISTLRSSNGPVTVYAVDGDRLVEIVVDNGNWSENVIRSGAECKCQFDSEEHPVTPGFGESATLSSGWQSSTVGKTLTCQTQESDSYSQKPILKQSSKPEQQPAEIGQQSLIGHPETTIEDQEHVESPEIPQRRCEFLRNLFSCFGSIFGHR